MLLLDVSCSYLFNLIGQFIGCLDLQDQCCRIISVLLETFKSNPSREIISVLGEQLQVGSCVVCWLFITISDSASSPPPLLNKKRSLNSGVLMQFLVSKLVACCIPSEAKGEQSGCRSSQVLSLLFKLTVHFDPSLHDYIRVAFLTYLSWSLPLVK